MSTNTLASDIIAEREAIVSVAQHRAALAKEGQRCQCTNGVLRSVGRDNDEVIEDCPNCVSDKIAKEAQP